MSQRWRTQTHIFRCWEETERTIACERRCLEQAPSSGVWGGTNLCQREKHLDVFIRARKPLQISCVKSTLVFLLFSQAPPSLPAPNPPDATIAVETQLGAGVAGDAQTNICAGNKERGDWNTSSV